MSVTGIEWPPGMVGHGDGMSGLVFAGGIAAAADRAEVITKLCESGVVA
jgi:hypothetical protein